MALPLSWQERGLVGEFSLSDSVELIPRTPFSLEEKGAYFRRIEHKFASQSPPLLSREGAGG